MCIYNIEMEVKSHGKMLLLTFENGEEGALRNALELVRAVSLQELCPEKTLLMFQEVIIDELRRVIFCNGREVELTYTEFEVLKLLASNSGIVFSKEQIYDLVWNKPYFDN